MARYEIDTNGELWIWNDSSDLPVVHQPTWPDNTPWKAGEAKAWAEAKIQSWSDPTADLPGDNPEQPTVPRPVIIEADLTDLP